MLRLFLAVCFYLLSTQLSLAQSIAPDVFQALQAAQTAQQAGNYRQAEQALNSVKAKSGSLELALLWRSKGYLAWAQGQTQLAITALDKAVQSGKLSDEQKAEDRLNLARLSFTAENYQQVQHYLQGLAATADSLELQIQAWQRLGRLDKALPLAERYLKSQSTISDHWLQFMVSANAELQRYAQAEQWQKRILQRNPDALSVWQQLAALQQMAGQYSKALATLRTAYSRGMTFQQAELDLLLSLAVASDQPWQAARLMSGMLDSGLIKANTANQERLAQLHWQARDYHTAAAHFARLAKQTGRGQHWLSLAQLEIQQGRWQAGLQALATAEQAGANPQQVTAWRDWAQSRIELDNIASSQATIN